MTFFALLTKEMRLSLRRERTIWLLVIYVVLLGLLGLVDLTNLSSNNPATIWSSAGLTLFTLLTNMQLFLICFIAPAFTATAVNGEKERQTFDMLLCSHLSAFDLVGGKLLAGLSNALLLIAASLPLFSLVFFFGGVSLHQALFALLIFVITATTTATFGLLCSTIFRRPTLSAAVTYMAILIWLFLPIVLSFMQPAYNTNVVRFGNGVSFANGRSIGGASFYGPGPIQPPPPLVLLGSPINALNSIITNGDYTPYSISNTPYTFGTFTIVPWLAYTLVDVGAIILFFFLSLWFIKPFPLNRLRAQKRKQTLGLAEEQEKLADSLT